MNRCKDGHNKGWEGVGRGKVGLAVSQMAEEKEVEKVEMEAGEKSTLAGLTMEIYNNFWHFSFSIYLKLFPFGTNTSSIICFSFNACIIEVL